MGSNASGRMNVTERDKDKKINLAIYVACQEKTWPRFKVALVTSKYLNFRLVFPLKTSLPRIVALANFGSGHVFNQNSYHTYVAMF